MRVVQSVHDFLATECPHIHAARLNALMTNVSALMRGRKLTVTGLGRAPGRHRNTKHDIKQSDRLIGNRQLMQERAALYLAVAQRLLAPIAQPIILIDWSDYTHNRSHILLRASVPVGGRALTLYEEVHPLSAYGNAAVQRAFLDTLSRFVEPRVQPVVVTDAGFIGPWFAEVRRLGWHFVGRIRKNILYRIAQTTEWQRCVELYPLATSSPQTIGLIELTRKNPLDCTLHILKKKPKGRHRLTASGKRARRKTSQDHVTRETQPWLIVTSLDPVLYQAKQVMQFYRTRMHIELAFRDIKNIRDGLALRETRSCNDQRLANLLLVGMLAHFCLWLIGRLAKARRMHYRLQANTERHSNVLSLFFIALQLVTQRRVPRGEHCFKQALALIHQDILHQMKL